MNTTKQRAGDTMSADSFRALLKKLKLTQAEAAEKLGFSRVTVCHWATGKRPIRTPNVSHIRRVLKPIRAIASC